MTLFLIFRHVSSLYFHDFNVLDHVFTKNNIVIFNFVDFSSENVNDKSRIYILYTGKLERIAEFASNSISVWLDCKFLRV